MSQEGLEKHKGDLITRRYIHPCLGNLLGYFLEENEVAPNLYLVVAEKESALDEENPEEDCPYQALVTKDNKIIVDFLKMDLLEYFQSRDEKHLYFNFTEENKKQAFHVVNEGGDYRLGGADIQPSVPDNFCFEETKYPQYWICRCRNSLGIEDLQIYSIEEEKFVSNVFHRIEFVKEETGYFAFVEKSLYDIDPEDPDEIVNYTSLFGYIREDFLFAADIYESTSEKLIHTAHFQSITDFERLEERIKNQMYWKYKRKLRLAMDADIYMLTHPNPIIKKPKTKEPCKVIAFSDKK